MNIIKSDSILWLQQQPDRSLPHIVTGFPEAEELKLDIDDYKLWLSNLFDLIFTKVSDDSYVIFVVTDRKIKGHWLSKPYLIIKSAEEHKIRLLWHKVALLRDVGKCHIQRPTYSHILCLSKKAGPGSVTPDVLPVSKRLYKNGTPIGVAEFVVDFVKNNNKVRKMIDPFCGHGTVGHVAVKQGFQFTGIDINPMCEIKLASHER